MKRLLLGLLFSGIFSCAVAQSEVCQPQLKALPNTDQLLKRGEWSIGLSNIGIPVYNGLTHLNGAYTYRVTPWLALGGGTGVLYLSRIHLSAQLFARIYVEVPQWNVSPFLILDAGGRGSLEGLDFMGNIVLGARFKLRNGDAVTCGFETFITRYGIGNLPLLHFAYKF